MEKVLESVPLTGFDNLIDWFSCTFDKSVHSIDDIIHLLDKYTEIEFYTGYSFNEELDLNDPENDNYFKLFPFRYNQIKERGYSKSLQYGHISIFYSDYGKSSKGYKLSFSGQGCREFELFLKEEFTFIDFLEDVRMNYKTNITRLDIAIDTFKEYFTIEDLVYYCDEQKAVTKFRKHKEEKEKNTSTGILTGHSLYFGTRKSRIFIRFYDKALEQNISGQHWIRTELQIMNENAGNALDEMIRRKNNSNYLADVGLGILNNYIKFCELEQTDENRSRWKTALFWETFINEAEKIKVGKQLPKQTIERKKDWIERQTKKSLALIIMHTLGKTVLKEHDLTLGMALYLKDIIREGYDELNEADLKLITHAIKTDKKALNVLKEQIRLNDLDTKRIENTINLLD